MKGKNKYLYYLLIAIALFVFARIWGNFDPQPEKQVINTKKFREILLDKEKELNLTMDSILTKCRPLVGNTEANLFGYLENMQLKNLHEKGFMVLVYLNDSLRFWSHNSISVNPFLKNSEVNNTLVKLNSAWYYVINMHEKNLDVFGLIRIRYDYPFTNKYLNNEYHEDFRLSSSIQISRVPVSHGFIVNDSKDNYLLTLVPTNSIQVLSRKQEYAGMIYLFGVFFLLLFFEKLFTFITLNQTNARWRISIMLMIILTFRFLMLRFNIPAHLYSLPYFNPDFYSVSFLFPSLGDFCINAIFILFLTRSAFYIIRTGKTIRFLNKKNEMIKSFATVLFVLAIFFFFNFMIYLLDSLIIHSNISLKSHKLDELDSFSLMAFFSLAILLASFIHLIHYSIFISVKILKIKYFIYLFSILSLIYFTLAYFQEWELTKNSFIFLLSLNLFMVFRQFHEVKYNYSILIILTAMISLFLTHFLTIRINHKETFSSHKLIAGLSSSRDNVAEHIFSSAFEDIDKDEDLLNLLDSIDIQNKTHLKEILVKKYFGGYFAKYDISVEISCKGKTPYAKDSADCLQKYTRMIDEYGEPVENSTFYYLGKKQEKINYLGIFKLNQNSTHDTCNLCISLVPTSFNDSKAYPEFLIDGRSDNIRLLRSFSHAKYIGGRLVEKSGEYPYDKTDKMFRSGNDRLSNINENDYLHTVYLENNSRFILTRPVIKGFDILISFSYIFFFINILLILIIAINDTGIIRRRLFVTFENKLLVAMLLILSISFLMVAAGTVYFNTRQFEKKHLNNIGEKMESVQKHLELELKKAESENEKIKEFTDKELLKVLEGLSEIYSTDINFYDFNGRLLTTTRDEIYKLGLLGTFMNPEAYRQMHIHEKSRYIQTENIGTLEYSSSYSIFKPGLNYKPYYLNLPHFSKPEELRTETTNLVVAIINLYVVLFILAALISFFMANKITQPLRILQNRFKNIELGRETEQIVYPKKDEIGALVAEYNRMVIKLSESIELLARSEREAAWREMAKQIAHEIKNPLTPMKLSVQFLQRSWQDRDSSFEKKLKKCTQTLIDQINTLSNIASEFSNFAKMPKPRREVVDMVVCLENIITLFSNTDNLTITSNIEQFSKLQIISDHEHISRAITNLVKNGIQAISEGKEGLIEINIKDFPDKIQIRISDNGSGISEEQKDKLFIPNFTTKSSGMGMGLPIVKDIIESAKGKIWFESQLNLGTTFIVELPLAGENEIQETEQET